MIINRNKRLKKRTSWNKGIPQSEEAKEKNRLAHLGKKPTEETRKKLAGRIPWNKGTKGICKPNSGSFASLDTDVRKKFYRRLYINGKYVYTHRVVMERYLGRKMESYEFVHHKNGDIHDNSVDNLEIISNSKHRKIHVMEQPRMENYL